MSCWLFVTKITSILFRRRKIKCWESSEMRFGKVSWRSEPCSSSYEKKFTSILRQELNPQPHFRKTSKRGSNFQNFVIFSGSTQTLPKASECVQIHPNRSEFVRTGPNVSENFEKLAKLRENVEKLRENFAKTSRTIDIASEGRQNGNDGGFA